jgi:DNA-binding CsgD family transcriptional regulator
MFRSGRGSRAEGKKGLIKFAVISLVCYILYFASQAFSEAGPSLRWAVPASLFLANISPILVLKGILSRFYRPILPGAFGGPRISQFCEQYQLSNREGEILEMLLKGKSNKEIERELFISPHTVRNHVHNIYQKLGVGSRLQLINFIRTWLESAENH